LGPVATAGAWAADGRLRRELLRHQTARSAAGRGGRGSDPVLGGTEGAPGRPLGRVATAGPGQLRPAGRSTPSGGRGV